MDPRAALQMREVAATKQWSLDGTACLLTSRFLRGDDKYLGAAVGEDGRVYGIPGTAREVLFVEPGNRDRVGLLGDTRGGFVTNALQRKRLKWLRGVWAAADRIDGSGAIYGIPANADRVLKVVPRTGAVTCVGPVVSAGTRWKYHGAVLAGGSKIVCIPACAERVLIIDTESDVVREIGPAFVGNGKWYGGLLGADGCVYGIPFNHDRVLRVDLETNEVSLIGPSLGVGGYKWHGGVRTPAGETIIGIPSHASSVLKIVPGSLTVTTIGEVEAGPLFQPTRLRFRQPGRYKYGGGVAVGDVVYAFPYDAYLPLRIDVSNDDVRVLSKFADEASRRDCEAHNKWQNGFVSRADGCAYAIPVSAQAILKIDPKTDIVSTTARELCQCSANDDKWEGGVVEPLTGAMYAVPQNAPYVLKIDPPDEAVEEIERYDGGRIVLRLNALGRVDGDLLGPGLEDRTGLLRWPARLAVGEWLAAHWRQLARPRTLLELGCGAGSCAAVAAKLGLDLLATDANEDCLELAAANVAKNATNNKPPMVAKLVWGRPPLPDGQFDIAFASDVVYPDLQRADLDALFDTASRALRDKTQGEFILGFLERGKPGRLSRRLFDVAHDHRCSAMLDNLLHTPSVAAGTCILRFRFDDNRPEPRLRVDSTSSPLHSVAALAFPGSVDRQTS